VKGKTKKEVKATSRVQASYYPLLDAALHKWYCATRLKVAIGVELLQLKSVELAQILVSQAEAKTPELEKLAEFKGSQTYITGWRKRYGLHTLKPSGEGADVDPALVEQARKDLPIQLSDFDAPDIYNLDELALFFKQQPDRIVVEKGTKGGKKSKDRVTIALLTNADGSDKRKAIMIGMLSNWNTLALSNAPHMSDIKQERGKTQGHSTKSTAPPSPPSTCILQRDG
jgi:hypothetical protein